MPVGAFSEQGTRARRAGAWRLALVCAAGIALLLLTASGDGLSYVQRRMLLAAPLARGGVSSAPSRALTASGKVGGPAVQLPSTAAYSTAYRQAFQRCRAPPKGSPPLPKLKRAGAWEGSNSSADGNATVVTTLHIDRCGEGVQSPLCSYIAPPDGAAAAAACCCRQASKAPVGCSRPLQCVACLRPPCSCPFTHIPAGCRLWRPTALCGRIPSWLQCMHPSLLPSAWCAWMRPPRRSSCAGGAPGGLGWGSPAAAANTLAGPWTSCGGKCGRCSGARRRRVGGDGGAWRNLCVGQCTACRWQQGSSAVTACPPCLSLRLPEFNWALLYARVPPSLAGLCNLHVELYTERVSRKLGAAMGLLPQAALQNRALQALKPEVGGWERGARLHHMGDKFGQRSGLGSCTQASVLE